MSIEELFHETMRDFNDTMLSYGKPESSFSIAGIEDLILTFCHSLYGILKKSYYLSSIDAGFGKTQALASLVKTYKLQGFLPAGGILIAFSTLNEIDDFICRSGLENKEFSVLVSAKSEMKNVGRGPMDSDQAPILLTTQQMIRTRLRDKSFSEAEEFHFNGRPRSLRVWDESMIPAESFYLPMDTINRIVPKIRPSDPEMTESLEALRDTVTRSGDSTIFRIPTTIPNRTAREGITYLTKMNDRERDAIKLLRLMADKDVRILKDKGAGLGLVGATAPLPDDLAPAIILDASGRVRNTYSVWQEYRGDLGLLQPVTSDYRRLTVHLWREKCGKGALANNDHRRHIIDHVKRVVEGNPGEWLLVTFKENEDFDIADELRKSIADHERLHSITWGKHHGVNSYKHIKNVIIIGNWFQSTSSYEAQYMAASGVSPENVVGDEWQAMRAGEYAHNLLQAACRSNLRNHDGKLAGECNLYVVASPTMNPQPILESTFPGCTIKQWLPNKPVLVGQAKALIEYLVSRFAESACARVSKADARKAAGITQPTRLAEILRTYPVIYHLEENGIAASYRDFEKKCEYK